MADGIKWSVAMRDIRPCLMAAVLFAATTAPAFAGPPPVAPAVTTLYTAGSDSLAAPYGGQENVVQNFSSFSSRQVIGSGDVVLSSSVSNEGTKPSGTYTGNYLAVGGVAPTFGTASYTYTLPTASPLVSFVLGSLDPYNAVYLSFSNGVNSATMVGSQILGGLTWGGDGRVTYEVGKGSPSITSITFESLQPALEIASIATAAPEPAAWVMMILGFGLVGSVLRLRRREGNLVIA